MSKFSQYLYEWSAVRKHSLPPPWVKETIIKDFLTNHPGCSLSNEIQYDFYNIFVIPESMDTLEFRQDWKNAFRLSGYEVPLLDIRYVNG